MVKSTNEILMENKLNKLKDIDMFKKFQELAKAPDLKKLFIATLNNA